MVRLICPRCGRKVSVRGEATHCGACGGRLVEATDRPAEQPASSDLIGGAAILAGVLLSGGNSSKSPQDPDVDLRAREAVNAWAIGGGALSAVTQNRWTLGAADLAMIRSVAITYGVTDYGVEAVLGIITTTLARECGASLPSSARPLINAIVLKAVGEAVIAYFKARSPVRRNTSGGDDRSYGLPRVK